MNAVSWYQYPKHLSSNTRKATNDPKTWLHQGKKIFQYCTCPAGRVTYNFHSSCKHMHLSFKSVRNKQHNGVICNMTPSSNSSRSTCPTGWVLWEELLILSGFHWTRWNFCPLLYGWVDLYEDISLTCIRRDRKLLLCPWEVPYKKTFHKYPLLFSAIRKKK